MRIAEILTEWKRPEIKDIAGIPLDPHFKGVRIPDLRRGPHQGRTLGLMLKGMKPAARISSDELQEFLPYVGEKFEIIDTIKYVDQGEPHKDYIITLKGQEWRGKKLMKIWPDLAKAYERNDIPAANKLHTQIGMLLGYPKEAIKFFVDPNQ